MIDIFDVYYSSLIVSEWINLCNGEEYVSGGTIPVENGQKRGISMDDKDMAILEEIAKKAGASAVKVVDVATVKRGAWPRMKCQYGCAQYGSNLCCPSYTPDISFMDRFLREYRWGLLVQYRRPMALEKMKDWQEFDRALNNDLLRVLLKIEKGAMMRNYYKAFALKAGRCGLCPVCNLKRCIHPESARPSLEACGIDVLALAEDNGFSARMYTGPVKEVTVYGMVLLE